MTLQGPSVAAFTFAEGSIHEDPGDSDSDSGFPGLIFQGLDSGFAELLVTAVAVVRRRSTKSIPKFPHTANEASPTKLFPGLGSLQEKKWF